MATPDPAPRPVNLTEQLTDRLREAILHGVYVPGQRLVEADLMADFGAGRGPVREALRRLGAEGVLDLIPNRGAMVRKLSLKELRDVFRMREALEGLAARLAAERMADPAVRRAFARALAGIDIAHTGENFSELNRRFHQLIVDFADNEQLSITLRQLCLPLVRLQFRAAINEAYRRQSADEHAEVARALGTGDADAAEAAMRRHLRGAGERVLRLAEREHGRHTS